MRFVMSGAAVLVAVALTAPAAMAQGFQAPTGTQVMHALHARTVATNERVLLGSIVKVDTSMKALTVKTREGAEQVVKIDSSTRINQGSRKLDVAGLAQVAGRHVKVRYQEQNGQMTADSIMVSNSVAKK
jgi:hypothetical protein